MKAPIIHCHRHHKDVSLLSLKKQRSINVYQSICNQISSTYQLSTCQLTIEKTPQGKPLVYHIYQNNKQRLPNCHISISHCQNMSIWSLSKSHSTLDIEPIKPRTRLKSLLTKLLMSIDFSSPLTQTPSQTLLAKELLCLPPSEQLLCFYKLWTFSEAWCKWEDLSLWKTFQQKIPFPWTSINHLLSCADIQPAKQFFITFNLSFEYHIICQLYDQPS